MARYTDRANAVAHITREVAKVTEGLSEQLQASFLLGQYLADKRAVPNKYPVFKAEPKSFAHMDAMANDPHFAAQLERQYQEEAQLRAKLHSRLKKLDILEENITPLIDAVEKILHKRVGR